MVIPTISFANGASVSDSADLLFQDYLQDQGEAGSLLAFRQREKFAGNIPSVPKRLGQAAEPGYPAGMTGRMENVRTGHALRENAHLKSEE
jgi:hypothetical protein